MTEIRLNEKTLRAAADRGRGDSVTTRRADGVGRLLFTILAGEIGGMDAIDAVLIGERLADIGRARMAREQ